MGNWLIIGANSGIARSMLDEFARAGHRLYLVDRKSVSEDVLRTANDLQIRHGHDVVADVFEALEFDRHAAFIEQVEADFGRLDGVVWVSGVMYEQEVLEKNHTFARLQHDVNYTAAMSILSLIAERMSVGGGGTIAAFGSPAGDRIRRINYYYGVDKQALHGFLDGLRLRFQDTGIHIVTVKPGPTATPMTANITAKKPLANADQVGRMIARGILAKKCVVYAPPVWQYIMFVIKHIPYFIFRRMKI